MKRITFLLLGILCLTINSNTLIAQDCSEVVTEILDLNKQKKWKQLEKLALANETRCCQNQDSLCFKILESLSDVYALNIDIKKCSLYTQKLLDVLSKIKDSNHEDFGVIYSNIGSLHNVFGQYDKAIEYINLAIENAEYHKDSVLVFARKLLLADAYCHIGAYPYAQILFEELYKEASTLNFEGKYIILPIVLKHTYQKILINTEQYEKALLTVESALNEMEKLGATQSFYYISFLNSKIIILQRTKKIKEAISVGEYTLQLAEEIPMAKGYMKGHIFNNQAVNYFLLREYDVVLEHLNKSTSEFNHSISFPYHDFNIKKNLNYISTHTGLNQIDTAFVIARETGAYIQYHINQFIDILSVEEKELLLQKNKIYYNRLWSLIYEHGIDDPDKIALGYYSELYKNRIIFDRWKQALSSDELRSNPELNKTLEAWKAARKRISHEIKKTATSTNLDSINLEIQKYERVLSTASSSFADYREKTDWKYIRKKLKPNEALVEYVRFNYLDVSNRYKKTDSIFYAAIIIRKNVNQPILVPMFEEKELLEILDKYQKRFPLKKMDKQRINKLYRNTKLYKLIWSPLEKELIGIQKINYVPSGLLHRISFATLRKNKSQTLLDNYDELVLINTGRDLVVKKAKQNKKWNKIVVFGGVDYNKSCEASDENTIVNSPKSIIESAAVRSGNHQDSLSFLPGTQKETESIKVLAKQKNIPAPIVWSGCKASEDKLKQVGDTAPAPKILHIATHGFAYKNKTSPNVTKYTFADNPLFDCGLFLAGANLSPNDSMQSDKAEDGILYAYDIANMNLVDTELVVLSSCSSGLGAIRNSEGVYGLQRAFKMAGAKNVLMSLWAVSDQHTQEFMTTFYQNLFSGLSINKAYKKTLEQIKNTYPDKPYIWAAFVLI